MRGVHRLGLGAAALAALPAAHLLASAGRTFGQEAAAKPNSNFGGVNVGIIARRPEYWEFMRSYVTAERVKQHFGDMVKGGVDRFELPNLHAINFLLHGALDGGGTVSLMTDAQGKTFSTAMLRMEIDLPADLPAPTVRA